MVKTSTESAARDQGVSESEMGLRALLHRAGYVDQQNNAPLALAGAFAGAAGRIRRHAAWRRGTSGAHRCRNRCAPSASDSRAGAACGAGSARANRRSVSASLPGAKRRAESRSAVVASAPDSRVSSPNSGSGPTEESSAARIGSSSLGSPPTPRRARRENAHRTARRIRQSAPAAAPASRARSGGCRRSLAGPAVRSPRATPSSAPARPQSRRGAAGRRRRRSGRSDRAAPVTPAPPSGWRRSSARCGRDRPRP